MRIPSGDLSPARRGRRYGGYRGYGRRRGRLVPGLVALACLAAVGGGAYALRRDDAAVRDRLAGPTPTPCATVTASSPPPPRPAPRLSLPATGTVSFRLLNGTARDGLGRTVGDELARRGFRVASTGNAPKALSGPSRVYFGPGARPAAQLVAIHVIGAELAPVPSAPRGAVDLVLGSGFTRLRTPDEVREFTRRVVAGTAPTAAPAATPTAGACA